MHILYVEDNRLDADLLQRELARLEPGFEVDLATTYTEAVTMLQHEPGRRAYEVVLTDQRLPDGTGVKLLNFVQEHGLDCAVVLLTGAGNDELVVTALKTGASDYVVKQGDYLARLPLVLAEAWRRHQTEAARRARPLRVLYAEHTAQDIDLTRRHFARYAPHLHLDIATMPEAVLHRLAGPSPLAYDVLLLDYNLPGLNGLELIKELLQTRRLDLPIVLVTGQGGEEVALQTLRLGALDYVVKSSNYLVKLPVIIENAFHRAQILREQTALRASEQRYRMLVEHVGEGIGFVDREEHFVFVNPAAERLFGLPPGGLLGQSLAHFTSPEQFAAMAEQTRQHQRDVKSVYEIEVCCPEGKKRQLLVTTVPQFLDTGEFSGTFGVFRDITERKQMEEALRAERALLAQRVQERTAQLDAVNQELSAKNQELNVVNTELDRAMRAKDEFLASMSHELRTPLTGILGLSETLQMGIYGPLTEKQNNVLGTIYQSGQHLLDLINDILDLSKVEAGKMELQLERLPLSDVCQASVQFVRQMALKKGLQLSTQLDARVREIRADGRRLKQVLVNLLSNAIKFTPEGGELGLTVEGDLVQHVVRFAVWDTGIGIAPADLARLFKPFVQLDNRLAREHSGTGLGLSLVLRMAELHGGSVAVESDGVPGKGSRFIVTLPWQASLQPPETPKYPRGAATPLELDPALTLAGAPNPTDALAQGAAVAARPLILIADDNATVVMTLTNFLSFHGYRSVAVTNGSEALAYARQHPLDLILMDIQMPGVDGLEAIRQLRADPAFVSIPIIAQTALVMPGDRERCLKAGANEYLAKPVNLPKLLEMLQALRRHP